jgi:hypothetical protein
VCYGPTGRGTRTGHVCPNELKLKLEISDSVVVVAFCSAARS